LPANLILPGGDGTQLSGFNTGADLVQWAASGGTTALDTTRVREGLGSLRLTPSAAGGSAFVQKSIAADMSGDGTIRLSFYLYGDPSAVSVLQLRFSNSDNMHSQFHYPVGASRLHQGWNTLTLSKDDFEAYADSGYQAPSWTDPMHGVQISLDATAGQTPSISLDDLRYGVHAQPVVLLSFKNGTSSQYDNAFPVMTADGFAGTDYVNTSDVGKNGQMTIAQLQALDTADWDIGNYTDGSQDLTNMTLAQARHALSDAAAYLTANGLSRGAHHVAYVDGVYNDTVLQAMHDTGMLTGTTNLQQDR